MWLVCSILGGDRCPWALLALGGGGLRWRFAGVSSIHVWLGLCHPRGCRYERGGVYGPFHVADEAGVRDL